MNILVIGNGFDTAHDLPTKYGEFLDFVKCVEKILLSKKGHIDFGNLNEQIKVLLNRKLLNENSDNINQKEIWKELIENNTWINYFLNYDGINKEYWIDFESEISRMIQLLEIVNNKISDIDFFIYKNIRFKNFKFLKKIYVNFSLKKCMKSIKKCLKSEKEYSYIRDFDELLKYLKIDEKIKSIMLDPKSETKYEYEFHKLLADDLKKIYENDLNKLIRALELYLSDYVSKLNVNSISPDIRSIKPEGVISFNYTNTYEKIYGLDNKELTYDYIHGKAIKENTIETNNMVLGINEYLPKKRKDKDVEFIVFKKYYQRIYKQTGCKYKEWVDYIKKQYDDFEIINKEKKENTLGCQQHMIYIFGHSLDITDGDILRDLILNDNVYTTIYYHNKKSLKEKISNLVKVIGQDELIKRTGGNTKTIEFKQQQDMVPIDIDS